MQSEKFILNRVKDCSKKSYIREHRIIRGNKYIHIGKNVVIAQYSRIVCIDSMGGEKYKPNLVIGDNARIGLNFTAFSSGNLIIEENALIASNVLITDMNHGMIPEHPLGYALQPYLVKDVHIGKNVWIGQNVVILPGVTIGDWAIIGAGSIVNRDVPSYCIVAGNPARIVKQYNKIEKEWKKVF